VYMVGGVRVMYVCGNVCVRSWGGGVFCVWVWGGGLIEDLKCGRREEGLCVCVGNRGGGIVFMCM